MTIEFDQSDLNSLAQENYECAKKCLESAHTSHEIAVKSSETLHEQGDQIQRVAENVDVVHETLDESEKKLDVISSLFGNVQSWFKSFGNKKPVEKPTVRQIDIQGAQFITRRHREQQQAKEEKKAQELKPYQKIDKQTDSLIDQIALAVEDIKKLSIHMGEELDRQNQDLTDVKTGIDTAVPRLQRATSKVRSAMD